MNTSIGKEIYECQSTILELKKIKFKVNRSDGKEVRFKIETKHWYGYGENGFLKKEKSGVNIDKSTMEFLINVAIDNLEQKINKIIDRETELRTKQKEVG